MQSTYMRPRSHTGLYEAQLAESLGFGSFWMGEHHFAYDGLLPYSSPQRRGSSQRPRRSRSARAS